MNIEQQLLVERTMRERGAESYKRGVGKAETSGRAHETTAVRRLMQGILQPIADEITAFANGSNPGRQGKLRPLMRVVDPQSAAFLTLQCLFNGFVNEMNLTSMATKLGRMVEDELRFKAFEIRYGDYYNEVMQDFKRKGTKSYQHKHRVLTHKANEYDDGWQSWLPSEHAMIGTKLLDIVLLTTDLVEKRTCYVKNKSVTILEPTADALKWIEDHHELRSVMFPERMPCVIAPDNWTDIQQGGYYSPELRYQTPLVRTHYRKHKNHVASFDLASVREAVNGIQQVSWRVNKAILDVVSEVWTKNLQLGMPASEKLEPAPSPFVDRAKDSFTEEEQNLFAEWKFAASEVYTQERKRVAKCFQISRIIRMAREYENYGQFWYVWTCDFRGRLYAASSDFSPQGPDVSKGLLEFARGCPLGEHGYYWMRVNIANRYGFDKASYDGRVTWVDDQRDSFRAAARDPLSHRSVWASADKPYQFLAAIMEYDRCCLHVEQGQSVESFVSHIPVGLDGSCNGLQNFSAMLRDKVGGTYTNLVPSESPADIYAQVGRVCTNKLFGAYKSDTISDDDKAAIQEWIDFATEYGDGVLPRSLAKRPVMTLPYGATRQSCTTYIYRAIMETAPEHFSCGAFRAATILTPLLWASIGDVVIAAREAMGWLQKAASAVSKGGEEITWTTPDGFPVWQGQYKQEDIRVRTQLAGDFRLQMKQDTDELDINSQRNAISPNFVHSMDASHLRETVRLCIANGVTELATIHDDFGTHAGNIPILHTAIRQAFVTIYAGVDPLDSFKIEQEDYGHELPDLPNKGELDINAVMLSPYFFG